MSAWNFRAGRVIGWAGINILIAYCLWLGFALGEAAPARVATFYIWFMFVLSIFSCAESAKTAIRAKGPAVPASLNLLVDIAEVVFLVWFGHVGLAVVSLISSLIAYEIYTPERTTA